MNKINRICPKCGGRIVSNEGNEKLAKGLKYAKGFLGLPGIIFGDMIDDQIDSSLGDKTVCEKCGYKWTNTDEIEFSIDLIREDIADIIEKHPNDCAQFYSSIKTLDDLIDSIQNVENLEIDKEFLLWKAYITKARLCFGKSTSYIDFFESEEMDWDGFSNIKRMAYSATEESFDYMDYNPYWKSWSTELYATIAGFDAVSSPEMYPDVFTILLGALMNDDHERNAEIEDFLNNTKKKMIEAWTPDEDGDCRFQFTKDKPFDHRRVIFIAKSARDVAGYWDRTDSVNYVFTPDCIPPDIKFPLGRPNVNTLYIANPVKPDEYIPYDNHEQALFRDKIRELRRLLRSLGATIITFTSMRGASIEEIEKSAFNVNAEGHYEIHKASGGASVGNRQEQRKSANQKVDLIEKLDPYNYPVLPDDLYWYESDPEWKDIVEARLHQNQLHFEQSISTNQVNSLDQQSQLDVNAAYENLMFSINANFHRECEFHVKTTEETMWRITAEFKPLSEFENSNKTGTGALKNLSSDEREYFEAMEECLENSNISERDRRMLERLRKSLGISEERAIELEATLTPKLTDDEKEYLEAVRECKEEGRIIERDRRMLERLRRSLGLSEERAGELESIV